MSRYYDRQGAPIDAATWAQQWANDDARVVGTTTMPNGDWVSTVWLGIDHNWSAEGPPLIFETMVFPAGDGDAEFTQRYSTEAAALAGHEATVAQLQAILGCEAGRP